MFRTLTPQIYCFCWLLVACSATAQQRDTAFLYLPKNQYFKSLYNSNSDISYAAPLGEMGAPHHYIFSAKVNPNFFISEKKKSPYALCVTPSIEVRMRANVGGDHSFAVRTPSYRIKFRGFYALTPRQPKEYRYLELQYTHHSNGQDGYVLQPNGQINTLTGSFSTNYGYVGYNVGEQSPKSSLLKIIGIEYHPSLVYHDAALLQNYGFCRLHLGTIYKKNRTESTESSEETQNSSPKLNRNFDEKWRLQAQFSYALNRLKNNNLTAWNRRANLEITFNYLPMPESKAGFYAAVGYYGEDPYNIFFLDHYAFFRLGCSVLF